MLKSATGFCLVFFVFAVILNNETIKAQSGGAKKWQSPDGKAFFVVPYNFRKQRTKDKDPWIGYWRSKSKKASLEFYAIEGQPPIEQTRQKWEQRFVDETKSTLGKQSTIANAGYTVWVTEAKKQDADSKEIELQQAVLVIKDTVYLLRGECFADAKKETRDHVTKAIYSLAKVPPEVKQKASGPGGQPGETWTDPSGDFSLFIPTSLGKQESDDPEVVGQWYSFALGIQIRVGTRPAPKRRQYDTESAFKQGFQQGFRKELEGTNVQFREIFRDGREIWTAEYSSKLFGVTTIGKTWVFRVDDKIHLIAIGYDPDIPEGIGVVSKFFESLTFNKAPSLGDGRVVPPVHFEIDNPKVGKVTAQVIGVVVMIAIGAFIFFRRKA